MTIRWIFLCVLFCFAECKRRQITRHIISWDPAESIMAYGSTHSIDVRIDEYMDVFCPQYDADAPQNKVNKFVIFNVSKKSFSECTFGPDTKKIFDCNTPNVSRVLTTKFQKYSPNPLGFTFHPGHSYYYMAAASYDTKSCNDVMRMVINVHPRLIHDHKPVTSTTTKTTSKTTTTTTTKPTKRSTILIPKIVTTPRAEPDRAVSSPKIGGNDAFVGGSATMVISLSIFWTVFVALVATLLLER